ncbi:Uncharacterised protein [Actinobacillus pleuropneumoniae]|nr:Uncharacterised protein [Actinobacillus pleuropneumoniae]
MDSGKAAAVAFAIGFLQSLNTMKKIRGQQRLEERYVRGASFNEIYLLTHFVVQHTSNLMFKVTDYR